MDDQFAVVHRLLIFAGPFAAYFIGIIIRKIALPGKHSPPLAHQCLLGIPVSLVIVSPTLKVLNTAITTDWPVYLFALGVIMEHGMLVQEYATSQLKKLLEQQRGSDPPRVI